MLAEIEKRSRFCNVFFIRVRILGNKYIGRVGIGDDENLFLSIFEIFRWRYLESIWLYVLGFKGVIWGIGINLRIIE